MILAEEPTQLTYLPAAGPVEANGLRSVGARLLQMKSQELLTSRANVRGRRKVLLAEQKRDARLRAEGIHQKARAENRALTKQEAVAFDTAVAQSKLVDAHVGHSYALDRPWASVGEFLKAVKGSEHATAKDPRLLAAGPAGANETYPSEGGFLVGSEMGDPLLIRTYETGKVISRCDFTPMGTPTMQIPRVDETSRKDGQRGGGIRVYRAAEAEAYTASMTHQDYLELNANKMIGFTVLTEDLYQDANAAALDRWVFQAFPREFSFRMDLESIKGTGAGEFLGLENSAATIVVAAAPGQASATVTTANIQAMYGRLWVDGRRTAAWFINADLEEQLMQLTLTAGGTTGPLYVPAGFAGNNTGFATMLGCPVIPIEQAELPGTKGDIILADMQEYLLGQRSVQSVNSIHVYWSTDQRVFRWTVRNDGMPKWKEPVVPYNGTITRSPFVMLAARP